MRRELRRLILLSPVAFALGFALWLGIRGPHAFVVSWGVHAVAQPLATADRAYAGFELGGERELRLRFAPPGAGGRTMSLRVELDSMHYNLLLFFALVLLTPGLGVLGRIAVGLCGWLLLGVTHVVHLLVEARVRYFGTLHGVDTNLRELSGLPSDVAAARWVASFLTQFGVYAIPVLLWLLLGLAWLWLRSGRAAQVDGPSA